MIGFLIYTLTTFLVAYIGGYFHGKENGYKDGYWTAKFEKKKKKD